MIHCQCGYVFKSDEFKYCPNCGEERIIAAPQVKDISRERLTVSTLKTILENAKVPFLFSIVACVDDQFDDASPEDADLLVIQMRDPEDGIPFTIGTRAVLTISAVQVNTESCNRWCSIGVRCVAKLKPPGWFNPWDANGAVQRLTDSSLVASFHLDTEGAERFIRGVYVFPLFFRTTEDDIVRTIGMAVQDIFLGFESILDRIHHP